jgi:hypothetical protein
MRDKLRAILPATVSTRVVAFAATACHGRPVGLVGLPGPRTSVRVRPVTQSVNQFCHTVVAGLPTFLQNNQAAASLLNLGGRLYETTR